MTITQR